MTELQLTRCARPTLTARRISTYTIMGFTGYLVANATGSVLAAAWELTVGERLIGFLVPPVAFLITVTVATAIAGKERIVFYQTALAAIGSIIGVGMICGARVERLLDLTTLGIGVFLVFGRLGCFSVACCHGTLGRGVVYGPPHVAVGFWARWSGRALWPVQLIESFGSAVLVAVALLVSGSPGQAAATYLLGYAALRFLLELVRGDGLRPYFGGLSEAQWIATGTAVACAVWQQTVIACAVAVATSLGAIALVASRRRHELFAPPHLHELDRIMLKVLDGERSETSLGVGVSRYVLPDRRVDWIFSASHPVWNEVVARRLGHALFPAHEVVSGRTPGVIHLITAPANAAAA